MVDDFIMTIEDSDNDDVEETLNDSDVSENEPDNLMKESENMNKEFKFDDDDEYGTNKWEMTTENIGSTEKKQAQSKMAFLDAQIEKKRKERETQGKTMAKDDDDNNDEDSNIAEGDNEDILRNIHENTGETKNQNDKRKESFFEKEQHPNTLIKSFNGLHLSRPLLKAITELGFITPTPIQSRTIPLALEGKDICAAAKTGSGKTAAYLLPCLERLLYRERKEASIRVLIITPTRELANQVFSMFTKLTQFTDITGCLVVGGLSLQNQATDLKRRPDVVVCTPGRMLDHLRNSLSVSVEDLDVLILDEADRLLDMGFKEEVNELIKCCPKNRQTLLFSATMTDDVDDLISLSLNKPTRIFVDPVNLVVDRLIQEFVRVRNRDTLDGMLLSLVSKTFTSECIIFCDKKREAHRLHIIFGLLGLKSVELHGDLTQSQRLLSLNKFMNKEADFLLATDVAGRGIDIQGVKTVINMHMPKDEKNYIHRVGRTARAGQGGRAITFVEEDDRLLMKRIVSQAIENNQTIKSRVISAKSIEKWSKEVEAIKDDIKEIYQAERVDREIEEGELEASRVKNIVKYQDEIHSRPKRTWFQSEKQKKETKQKDLDSKSKRTRKH